MNVGITNTRPIAGRMTIATVAQRTMRKYFRVFSTDAYTASSFCSNLFSSPSVCGVESGGCIRASILPSRILRYTSRMKTYTGTCHCGTVRYEVTTDLAKTLVCNCSHCHAKGFILHFVDRDAFKLLSGADKLTSYQFNKKQIDHVFCSVCDVQSYARGIAFPQVAINVRCLEGVDTDTLTPDRYNGRDV